MMMVESSPSGERESDDELLAPLEASFIVRGIRRYIFKYSNPLTNGEYDQFEAKSFSDKVDTIAWDWGGREDLYERSIDLRALKFAHRILRFALKPDFIPSEDTRPFQKNFDFSSKYNEEKRVYLDGEYWAKVDSGLYWNILSFAKLTPDISKITDKALEHLGKEDELATTDIAVVRGNVIHREVSFRPDGHKNQAIYAVYPEGYPAKFTGAAII